MFNKILVFIFLTVISYSLKSANDTTVLFGTNIEYANSKIEVYAYDDFISKKLVLLTADSVDHLGRFELKVPIHETRLIHIPFDYYDGLLYVEPGLGYEIILPENKKKTFVDILNPYFQKVEFYLGIKGAADDNINLVIFEFDDIYERYVDENYYSIYRNPQQASVDTVIKNIETLYDTVENPYFKNYRLYKYALLKYVSYMRNNLYITKDYFNDLPLLYQNTAYMELFNQLYAHYLKYYMTSSEGERIYSDINLAKSPYLAKETFSNNLVLKSDSIQELVLLKGINDAFMSNEFAFKSLLIVLDSIADYSSINEHRKIAKNIKDDALHLRMGYASPGFSLEDSQGVIQRLDSYAGNYVYLNFCSVESFPCQQDFTLLKEFHKKHGDKVEIVSVVIDDDFEMAKKYFESNGLEWTLLKCDVDKSVLDAFRVRAYPSYYLIGPKGNMIMSPAVSPSENFEYRFFSYLRDVKRANLRNSH